MKTPQETAPLKTSSGIKKFDQLLGDLHIGDNVVWYDDAGSLASVFYLNFIEASIREKKPIIYVSFDRSPKNLLEHLGPLAETPLLTILDCFTHGKGDASEIFLNFYQTMVSKWPCQIIQVEDPRNIDQVKGAFYGVHGTKTGDVRFVFESLTGMQELWNGEEQILNFYASTCPRLYELNTIAYWVIEKKAHSQRLRAHINKTAQVAIELSLKRGKTFLSVIKADKRNLDETNTPIPYWHRGLEIIFETQKQTTSRIELGTRLKGLRSRRGLSQTDLAKQIGVTPSTISQVESNQIYPSIPALLKLSEILSVPASSFFENANDGSLSRNIHFHAKDAAVVSFPNFPKGSILGKMLLPLDKGKEVSPYLIEIMPKTKLTGHFFQHKGPELGFLISGTLHLQLEQSEFIVKSGDTLFLTQEVPTSWKNDGPTTAKLIWLNLK